MRYDDEPKPPPEDGEVPGMLGGITQGASRLVRRAADEAARAAGAGKDLISQAGTRAQRLWMPEDPDLILASPSFQPFPAGGPAPEMLSIAWQSDALVGLSALGCTVWERDIVMVTRSVFHDGLPHQDLSRRLFGTDFDAIHRWIDTVPGSGIRGGGVMHRLQHGHDLQAAQHLYDEHGLPGLMVWMQHVAQDFATPTGVPIPMGAARLGQWLVDTNVVGPKKAVAMLSFNAAGLAGTAMRGAFALRLASLAAEFRRQRQVARRCGAARDAWARGDLDAVIANYSEARSLSDDDPTILMALGWAYGQMGRPAAETFLAFRDAAMALAREDRAVEVDGVTLSLRGLAYLLALSHAVQVLEEADLRGAWRAELDRMLRGAISAFERTALAQADGPAVRMGERELAFYRPRPFSAAANYYLAARLAWSAPFLPSSAEALRLSSRALEMQSRAAGAHPQAAEAVEGAQSRWAIELSGKGMAAA
jgi:hypothetical protein